MNNTQLSESNWKKLYTFLQTQEGLHLQNEAANRQFVEAVFWVFDNNVQWRQLPQAWGQWNSIYKRFARWEEKGIWLQIYNHFAADPEMPRIIKEGTILRTAAA